MNYNLLLFILAIVLSIDQGFSQEVDDNAEMSILHISGVVIDEQGYPLANANIFLAKNGNIGTTSNYLGQFNLTIEPPTESIYNDTIQINYIGYYTYKIAINSIVSPTNMEAYLHVNLEEAENTGLTIYCTVPPRIDSLKPKTGILPLKVLTTNSLKPHSNP